MRNCWLGLIALVTFTVPVNLSYGQEEFPPTVDELGVELLLEPVSFGTVNPEPLRLDELFQPFYRAYFTLEKIDDIMLETVDYFLKEPEPQPATPYRTHGGVI